MSSLVTGLIVLALVIAVLAFLTTRNASVNEIRAALKAGAKIVDVRSRSEFQSGHFPGAIHIPVDQISAHLGDLGSPEQPLILYCHSGMRSGSAMHIVKGGGFKHAVNAGTLARLTRASESGQ
jgi:phage shock protein E